MEAIARLEAIEDIRQLKARYFRFVDNKDWDGLCALFAPDIVFDRTFAHSVRDPWSGEWTPPLPDAPWLVHGRDAVMAMIQSAVGDLRTVHHGHLGEIAIESAEEASATWGD